MLSDYLYRSTTGQYHNKKTNRFISRPQILRTVAQESQALGLRLRRISAPLLSDTQSVADFQRALAQELKNSYIQTAMVASGGKDRIGSSQYGAIGQVLKEQYKLIDVFGQAIANGELSSAQVRARAGSYSRSLKIAFHATEKATRKSDGFNEAKRNLDGQAEHCESCIRYAGWGWVGIDRLVVPGTKCICREGCRCNVVYRKG
jgi:hypothetical protein